MVPDETPAAETPSQSATKLKRDKKGFVNKKAKGVKVFIDSPVLDRVFTGIFIAEVFLSIYSVATVEGRRKVKPEVAGVLVFGNVVSELQMLSSFVLLTVAAVQVSQIVFGVGGSWVSRTLLAKPHPADDPLRKRKTLAKFEAQSWQLVIHTAMSLLEWAVLADEDWIEHGVLCVLPKYQISPAMICLYMAQLAIWIYTCFCHIWLFEKQKDYWVMFGHHLATIGLVLLSYHFNYVRHGAIVLWVHDLSDVPADLVKMANYMKLEDFSGLFLTELSFAAVLVSWAYYRLYVFAVKIVLRNTGPLPGLFYDTAKHCNAGKSVHTSFVAPQLPGSNTLVSTSQG
jgi:hypothetical protein